MSKKKALGRGLSALISTPAVNTEPKQRNTATARKVSNINMLASKKDNPALKNVISTNQVIYVGTSKLSANPGQPRKVFNETELQELAASIKSLGLIQPIVARVVKDSDTYEIVAGERRYRAAKIAKLAQVPVIIRELGEQEAMEIALVENIQRSNLNAIEEARAYQALMDEFQVGQEEIAKRTGKSRSTISNFVRILTLPNLIQDLIQNKKLSMGHAKAILSIKEPKAQLNLTKKILAENLSVRAVENIVGTVIQVEGRPRTKARVSAMVGFSDLENKLKNQFGTKVKIKTNSKGGGQVSFDYYSEEEFSRLIDLLIENK